MTTEGLINEATKQIKSQAGYSYVPSVVEEICSAGWDGIEDGAVMTRQGGHTVRIDKSRNVLSARDEDGNEYNTSPLTDELKDKAIILTAIRRSRKGHQVGTIR